MSRASRIKSRRRCRGDRHAVVHWLQAGAVAVGVGAAMIGCPAIAVADDASSSPSDTSSSASGDNSSSADSSSDKPSSSESSSASSVSTGSDTDDTDADEASPVAEPATSTPDSAAADENPAIDTAVVPEPTATDSSADAAGASTSEEPNDSNTAEQMTTTTTAADTNVVDVTDVTPDTDAEIADAATPAAEPVADSGSVPAPELTTTTHIDAVVVQPSSVVSGIPPVSLRSIVDDIVRWFGWSPLDATAPLPTQAVGPFLQAVWVAVRRAVEQLEEFSAPGAPAVTVASVSGWLAEQARLLFANSAPTATPVQLVQNRATGVLLGSLGVTDANGDALQFEVTRAPGQGTVVVNPDGSYVYTPSAGLAANGGQDTFEVNIYDRGWHLFGDDDAAVTVPVTVTITPVTPGTTDTFEPLTWTVSTRSMSDVVTQVVSTGVEWVISRFREATGALADAVADVLVDQAPGADVRQLLQVPYTAYDADGNAVTVTLVYGTLNAADPNGDSLTYTVIDPPEHGGLMIDENGVYGYVVTDPDLVAAGGQDSFTVAITDNGWHPFGDDATDTIYVPVTVSFSAADPTNPEAAGDEAVQALAALAGGGPVPPGDTYRTFTVWNLTTRTLTYDGAIAGDKLYGPFYGTAVLPGEAFEIQKVWWYFGYDNNGNKTDLSLARFTAVGGALPHYLVAMVNQALVNVPEIGCASLGGTCTPLNSLGRPAVFQDTAVLLDPPGTTATITASNAIGTTLEKLCNGNSKAQCKFTPSREISTFTTPKATGTQITNNTTQSLTTTKSVEISSSTSNNVNVALNASVSLLKIVELGVSAEYGHSFTQSHTYRESMDITVPVGQTVAVYAMSPVTRIYGDFTITYGNSTMTVKDVYFDTPDPNGAVRYVVQQCPGSAGSCQVPQSLLDEWNRNVRQEIPRRNT